MASASSTVDATSARTAHPRNEADPASRPDPVSPSVAWGASRRCGPRRCRGAASADPFRGTAEATERLPAGRLPAARSSPVPRRRWRQHIGDRVAGERRLAVSISNSRQPNAQISTRRSTGFRAPARAPCRPRCRGSRRPGSPPAGDVASSGVLRCPESHRGPSLWRVRNRAPSPRRRAHFDVGGLQVAMDDALLVCRLQASAIWRATCRTMSTASAPRRPRDQIRKRRAFNELHHQRRLAGGLLDAVNLRDIGVIERGEDLGLAREADQSVRIRGKERRQILMATSRCRRVSRARKTSPMPPAPIVATICRRRFESLWRGPLVVSEL